MLVTVGVVVGISVVTGVVVLLTGVKIFFAYKAGICRSTRSMKGKTVIVTGATAGIGKETARDLLRRGARVILACRNLDKGSKVEDELRSDVGCVGEVVVRRLDTSNLTSVRAFAKDMLDNESSIHVLINNAGIVAPGKRQLTADDLELTMATNHFGHFLLTNLLLGRLKESAPSRIVNVSSIMHKLVKKIDLNDLTLSNKYSTTYAYSVSKLCNILFTRELADKLAGTGVIANSLHPGAVRTEILYKRWNILAHLSSFIAFLAFKDAATGAQTNIHLAVCEEVEGVTGRYFEDCKESKTSKLAQRKDLATGLWEASVKAVGLQQIGTPC